MKGNRGGVHLRGVAFLGLVATSPLPAQEPKLRSTFEGHKGQVKSVAFNNDGTLLASGSWDGTVKLWDVKTGKEKANLQHPSEWLHSLALNSDGTLLASGCSDMTVRMWELPAVNKEKE